MAEVQCPVCGMYVSSRGLYSHKGSGPCIARRDLTYIANHDLAPVGLPRWVDFLQNLHVPMERLVYGHDPGGPHRRSSLKYAWFGPGWVRVVHWTDLSIEAREALVHCLLSNPEIVAAFRAVVAADPSNVTAHKDLLYGFCQQSG